MITVKNVVSGVSAALSAEFNSFDIYIDEVPQGLEPPCFTITCAPSVQRVIGRRFRRDFDICVYFFPATDEKYSECADVEERLFSALQYINVDGDLLRGEGLSRRLSDGVLAFNVRFSAFVIDSETAEIMGDLEVRSQRSNIRSD